MPRCQLLPWQSLYLGRLNGNSRQVSSLLIQSDQESNQNDGTHAPHQINFKLRCHWNRLRTVLPRYRLVLLASSQYRKDCCCCRSRRHFWEESLWTNHKSDPTSLKSHKTLRSVRILHKWGRIHKENNREQGDPIDRRRLDVQASVPFMFLQGITRLEITITQVDNGEQPREEDTRGIRNINLITDHSFLVFLFPPALTSIKIHL